VGHLLKKGMWDLTKAGQVDDLLVPFPPADYTDYSENKATLTSSFKELLLLFIVLPGLGTLEL